MGLLSRVGKAIPTDRMATGTAGIMGVAFLAGMGNADPLKPVFDYYEDVYMGDPDAMSKMAKATVSTHFNDAFEGTNVQSRLNELRSPIRRPRDFSPPGELVFGMYNSRIGG